MWTLCSTYAGRLGLGFGAVQLRQRHVSRRACSDGTGPKDAVLVPGPRKAGSGRRAKSAEHSEAGSRSDDIASLSHMLGCAPFLGAC